MNQCIYLILRYIKTCFSLIRLIVNSIPPSKYVLWGSKGFIVIMREFSSKLVVFGYVIFPYNWIWEKNSLMEIRILLPGVLIFFKITHVDKELVTGVIE